MMTTSVFLAFGALFLVMLSAHWFRVTRRDIDAASARALRKHLDWRPAPRARNRHSPLVRR